MFNRMKFTLLALSSIMMLTACDPNTNIIDEDVSLYMPHKPSSMFYGEFLYELRLLSAEEKKEYSNVFEEAMAINTSTFGVIAIPSLDILEPIVMCSDNSEYLRKGIDGSYDKNGTSFLDANASIDSPIRLIHGHNMQNDIGFSHLVECLDYSVQELRDTKIYLYEDFGVSEYRIFSVFTVESTGLEINTSRFATEEEIYENADAFHNLSTVPVESYDCGDIIVLNTCWYGDTGDLHNHHCIVAACRV